MGTRSAIAFKNEENYTIVHCHWDGYPEGLGQTLQENIIKLGYERVYQFFKDTNVSLWRQLCGCDFSMSAYSWNNQKADNAIMSQPEYYNDSKDIPFGAYKATNYEELYTTTSDLDWVEWLYIIDVRSGDTAGNITVVDFINCNNASDIETRMKSLVDSMAHDE